MPTTSISRCGGGSTAFSYYQVIAALALVHTLIAEWHFTEGADPWADTSGFSPGSPATVLYDARTVTMTKNFAAGPLAAAPAGPSVKFNYDGTSAGSQGDFLDTGPAARFAFAGNSVFSVVAWVLPTQGVNSHNGPVVSTVTVTSFGGPSAHDDGWRINVVSPTQECLLQRYCNVTSGGVPDSVSLGAMSTAAWTMVAMTYDGAMLRGYANGSFVGQTASAGAVGNGFGPNFGLGTEQQATVVTWYYGACSEITVWGAVLSASDLALLYASHSN